MTERDAEDTVAESHSKDLRVEQEARAVRLDHLLGVYRAWASLFAQQVWIEHRPPRLQQTGPRPPIWMGEPTTRRGDT